MTEEEAYRAKHAAAYEAREREYAAERAKHLRGFEAAARKLDRELVAIEQGDDQKETAFRRGLERLHDRRNKPEIRGNDTAREACDARIDELRARLTAAIEIGRIARSAARDEEIRNLRDEAREAEHARGGFAKELILLGMLRRGGK